MIPSANRGETLKMEEVAGPLKQRYQAKCVMSHLRPIVF